MTSINRISAHCTPEKQVVVRVFNMQTNETLEEFTLQDKESKDVLIYDDRAVQTCEVVKPTIEESASGETPPGIQGYQQADRSYTAALSRGFQGTEEEWTEALQKIDAEAATEKTGYSEAINKAE